MDFSAKVSVSSMLNVSSILKNTINELKLKNNSVVSGMLDDICMPIADDLERQIQADHPSNRESYTKYDSTSKSKKVIEAKEEITPLSYFEEGTKTHMIKPLTKKALMFNMNGGKVFSKGHKVKGLKANRYFEKTIRKLGNVSDREISTKFFKNLMNSNYFN